MSAIVAAAARMERARLYTTTGIAGMMGAAGRAIVDASNAACRAMVVRGAPRTWAIRWSLWRSGYWYARTSDWRIVGEGVAARADLVPCWNAGSRLWVWGSAAHDPRPCAWPRPFARGADR